MLYLVQEMNNFHRKEKKTQLTRTIKKVFKILFPLFFRSYTSVYTMYCMSVCERILAF